MIEQRRYGYRDQQLALMPTIRDDRHSFFDRHPFLCTLAIIVVAALVSLVIATKMGAVS